MAAAATNSHGVTGSVAAIDSAWSSDKNSDSESDSVTRNQAQSPNQSAIGGAAASGRGRVRVGPRRQWSGSGWRL